MQKSFVPKNRFLADFWAEYADLLRLFVDSAKLNIKKG